VNGEKPREIAMRLLRQHQGSHDYIERLLENELARHSLSPPDRGLCQELVFGLVRWQRTLDWLIARKTAGRAQNAGLRLLLHLGLYQMFWLERIPAHAAVHETVELGKRLGFGAQTGFLNAVLRGYSREREATLRQLEHLKQTDPALGYSHPVWLVERWQARWGAEQTSRLLQWNNSPPPTYARLNILQTDLGGLIEAWEQEGVRFVVRHWDWTGENLIFELTAHASLAHSNAFQRGFFYVQDPSTLLAVRELNPQPGEKILDLCAAPGGKTTYIAQRMGNQGRLVAQDNQPQRMVRLRENCARLGVTCVVEAMPAEQLPFDRILVDAPCSNTGVLRRRVDLRWRIKPEELTRLRQTQLTLLDQAAARLKPGGTLVYSTCSLEPEENEMVAREFLEAHPRFTLKGQRQLLPFADGVDGAYVASMVSAEV
jgi:16S rRNA (cytosine967-C5)-methyltransferase